MRLYRVTYCSRNVLASSTAREEIESILAKSRANNARDGVTGGLLFTEGCFAQVLEGPMDAVERAFERIQCDDRHADVTVLESGHVGARDFPDWSMGFTGLTTPCASDQSRIAQALSRRTSAGDDLLGLLKDVVKREHEWLAPVSRACAA